MSAELTAPGSKPKLVDDLSSTWRKSAEHLAEQFTRFIRLTALAAVPSIWNLVAGGKFDWRTLLAFIVPFAEVAWRQAFPALPADKANKAPGVTIVPAEVGHPVRKKAAAKKTTAKKTAAKKQ